MQVRGSRTGAHAGRLRAYSQGDGASFVPATPFRAGEMVAVQATLTSAGRAVPIDFTFQVAVPDTFGEARRQHAARSGAERIPELPLAAATCARRP